MNAQTYTNVYVIYALAVCNICLHIHRFSDFGCQVRNQTCADINNVKFMKEWKHTVILGCEWIIIFLFK